MMDLDGRAWVPIPRFPGEFDRSSCTILDGSALPLNWNTKVKASHYDNNN